MVMGMPWNAGMLFIDVYCWVYRNYDELYLVELADGGSHSVLSTQGAVA